MLQNNFSHGFILFLHRNPSLRIVTSIITWRGHSAYKTIQKADEGNDAFPNPLLIWNYTDSPITLIVLQHLMLGVHDCLPQHQMKPFDLLQVYGSLPPGCP